jgi:hypothetical protein
VDFAQQLVRFRGDEVRTHSSVPGLRHFSQMAASAKGSPDFMAMA